ncbi:MAG: hypothetical protein ACTMIR_08485 [Cellulomonadaceae bacterium]
MSTVIATKVANVLLDLADLPALCRDLDDGVMPFYLRPTLEHFQHRYGGVWVGGRVTVTAEGVRFAANAVNAALHRDGVELFVPHIAITAVTIDGGVMTKIIALRLRDGSTLRLRCWGAHALADTIRTPTSAPRP